MYMQMDRGSRDGELEEWEVEDLVRGSGSGRGDGSAGEEVDEVQRRQERMDWGNGSRDGFRRLVSGMLRR
jgi:hypothetical protein